MESQQIKADHVLLEEGQRNALRAYLDSQYKLAAEEASREPASGSR